VRIDAPDLRRRVRVTGTGPLEDDAVKKAEQALAGLAPQFAGWMQSEIRALMALRKSLRAKGLTPDLRSALYRVAHDIRGEAATLGFPFVGRIAASLVRLLYHSASPERIPLGLLLHHVDAMRAIVSEGAEGEDNRTARALAVELEALVERHVLQDAASAGSSAG